jgi:hypothetical protein
MLIIRYLLENLPAGPTTVDNVANPAEGAVTNAIAGAGTVDP